MKALSIKEPWAGLIFDGFKTIETRKWKTKYRGKMLLCASKKPVSLISGMAFATANLVDCRDMVVDDESKAGCKFYPYAKAWVLEDIEPIKLFPITGKLGLFDVDYTEVE